MYHALYTALAYSESTHFKTARVKYVQTMEAGEQPSTNQATIEICTCRRSIRGSIVRRCRAGQIWLERILFQTKLRGRRPNNDDRIIPLSRALPDSFCTHKVIRRIAHAAATQNWKALTNMELWNTAGTSDSTASSFMGTLGDQACIDFHKEFLGFGVAFKPAMRANFLATSKHEVTDTIPRHGR